MEPFNFSLEIFIFFSDIYQKSFLNIKMKSLWENMIVTSPVVGKLLFQKYNEN